MLVDISWPDHKLLCIICEAIWKSFYCFLPQKKAFVLWCSWLLLFSAQPFNGRRCGLAVETVLSVLGIPIFRSVVTELAFLQCVLGLTIWILNFDCDGGGGVRSVG